MNLRRAVFTLYAAAVCMFLALAFLRQDWETPAAQPTQDHAFETITVVQPALVTALYDSAAALALLLLACAVARWKWKRIPLPGLAVALALAGFPAAFLISIVSHLAPWTTCSTLRAPDGHTYFFMDSSFLQGQTLALARLRGSTFFTRTMEDIGDTSGDSPRSFTPVIRPADAPDGLYGQLFLSPDGKIAGLRSEDFCYFAYDLKTRRFLGRGDVRRLSPFLLIGPETAMKQTDIERLLAATKTKPRSALETPWRSAVADNVNHPNPAARKIARQLLEMIDAKSGTDSNPE